MICFTWSGLPYYGAKAVEAFVAVSKEPVCVLATRPKVPVKGLENVLSCKLIWVNSADESAHLLLTETPRVVFISNWNIPAWRPLEKRVRESGGSIVAMMDNDFQWSWRILLKALHYRLFLARRFDAIFVPGESGRKLAKLYGVRTTRIFMGLYCADGRLFHDGRPLPQRDKKIIYVGQLCERKNILPFCRAFQKAIEQGCANENWTLEIYGAGRLRDELTIFAASFNATHKGNHVLIHDFVQSTELSKLYRSARVFVLPSVEEHWGVVVHEATLSGCCLLLSNRVGATADFANRENSWLFDPCSIREMTTAIQWAMRLSDEQLLNAQRTSIRCAANFSVDRFVESVSAIVDMIEADK